MFTWLSSIVFLYQQELADHIREGIYILLCVSIMMLWFVAIQKMRTRSNLIRRQNHKVCTVVQLSTHIYSISLYREASGCSYSGDSDGPVV